MKTFFLSLLIIGAACAWTNPTELFKYDGALVLGLGMYTDPTTRIHHVLFTSHDWDKIHYYQVDYSHRILSQSILTGDLLDDAYSGQIVGMDDGKRLYIAINGIKTKETGRDIWYTESNDNGKTWLPLSRIPRANMNDTAQRTSVSLLVPRENGRVFLIYRKQDAAVTISMITKPPNSRIFSQEMTAYKAQKMLNYQSVSAKYTIVNSETMIHVFWAEFGDVSPMMYMNSGNNGNSWSTPKIITTESSNPHLTQLPFATNPKISSAFVGVYGKFPGIRWRMTYSKDNGKSFGIEDLTVKPGYPYKEQGPTVDIAICGTAANPIIVSMAMTSSDEMEYSIWSLNNMRVRRLSHPFTNIDMYTGIKLTCQLVTANEVLLTAAVPVIGKDRLERMLIASDTISLS